jgi:hypothetical protein
MALRFIDKDDADREVTRTIRTSFSKLWWQACCLSIYSVVVIVVPHYFVKLSQSGECFIVGSIAFLWMLWLVPRMCFPYYQEFRLRTKDLDGKVSAIEAAVSASAEQQEEVISKLTEIENTLNLVLRKLGR